MCITQLQNQALGFGCGVSLPYLYPSAVFVCVSSGVQSTRLTVRTDAGDCFLQDGGVDGQVRLCTDSYGSQLKFTM